MQNGILNIENKKLIFRNQPTYTLFVNEDEFLLSSDYIGPSIYWARECGIEDSEIREFLKICRTIGGHIVWPRGTEIRKKK